MRLPILAALLAAALPSLHADEGMWTFDNLPLKQLKEKYGFEPSKAWIDHVRLSAVKFGGGSGSFVSPDGLVITNHHVGRFTAVRVDTPELNLIKNGFVAKTREAELKVPGMTLRTLEHMEDVTAKVAAAVKPGMSEAQAAEARKQAIEGLINEAHGRTGLLCESVNLYNGGETWIYGYKTFDDVRLVMAPEGQVAFYGGDPDNFTYPRHDLDIMLFRIYENGKPYQPKHFLNFTREGLKAGDLSFVIGNPGSTSRLDTVAQMEYARDKSIPTALRVLEASREALKAYADRSPEHERQVLTSIFGLENSLKSNEGALKGLKDAEALANIRKAEKELQAKVAQDPKLAAATAQSWAKIQAALKTVEGQVVDATLFSPRQMPELLRQALSLVRIPAEAAKPEARRLPGFSGKALEAQQKTLLAPATAAPELTQHTLAAYLRTADKMLPKQSPLRPALFKGAQAEALAAQVAQSKLGDAAVRKQLLDGGSAAVKASTDPLIQIALRIDPVLRQQAKAAEASRAIIAEHGARIAKARFAVYGKSRYPDATGTLRLSYGAVESYRANGTWVQPFTTFHGLFDRHLGWGGNAAKAQNGSWTLPQRWLDRKGSLNLETPLGFCHGVDIIGGNSGSPVLDRKGDFAGIIYDGNIESLPGRYFYDGKVNRGVSLDARAIVEALGKVYDAQHLVDELMPKR